SAVSSTTISPIPALALHDALPISRAHTSGASVGRRSSSSSNAAFKISDTSGTGPPSGLEHALQRSVHRRLRARLVCVVVAIEQLDRKSTRLNSSHVKSSYAVFCLE